TDAEPIEGLPDVARRPSWPAWAVRKKPASRARANTCLNLPGGFPRSDESSPTPTMRSLNGSAASRVRSASASSRWRRKHMIRLYAELSPGIGNGAREAFDHGRERDAAAGVALRVEEHLDVADIVGVRAREIGEGKIVEILLGDQHRHALIVEIEKILQVAEPIGLPHRVDRRIRQADAVAA